MSCSKGEKKEKHAMEEEYGEEKGEKVFFAKKNKQKHPAMKGAVVRRHR